MPHEATFSRAFAEFAQSELPQMAHEALIALTHKDRLVGHIARDATAIHGREKAAKRKEPASTEPKIVRKRGRPRKGEEPPPKPLRRISSQAAGMSLGAMLADLPKACDVGIKRNAKGYQESWIGYKLHIDTADGDIPISCILTSASVHDSQVAIPLATLTSARVTNFYDLMDSAYDVPEIADHSRSPVGHSEVRLALRRAGRAKRRRPKQALGLSAEMLDKIIAACPESLAGLRDAALLSVGYDTPCRSSELVATF